MGLETQNLTPSTLPVATKIATELVATEHRQIVVIAPPTTPRVLSAIRSRPMISGTIAAGARMVSITNIGTANGIVAGQPLEVDSALEYPMTMLGDVYGAIAYDASGTKFDILEVR